MATSTQELIQTVYRKVSGEIDPSVTADTEDGQTILSVINEQVDYYYNAVDRYGERVVWSRNIDPEYVLGYASPSETVYEIDWDEVQALPDGFYMPIRVGSTRYDLVPFEQLYDPRCGTPHPVALSSEGLVFAEAPEEEGEILFPCIPHGKHLEGGEEDVEAVTGVHNVLWLTYASAAEYVRTDIVRGEQYPNILAQANDVYSRMVSDNAMRTAALNHDILNLESVSYDW